MTLIQTKLSQRPQMAPLFTSTSLQRRELLPLPPCNYFSPSTPPAFNFCSSIHTFLPNTIHFSANLSPNSRAKSINFKLYEKLDSGFCSSKCNFGWVVSSFGDCNSLLLLEESVVLGFVKNGVCSYGCKNVADSVREGFKNKGKNGNFWKRSRKGSGFCSSRCNGKWVGTKMVESVGNGFISKGQSWDFEKSTRMDPGFRSVRHGDDGSYARVSSYACNGSVKEKIENEYVNGNNASNGVKVKTMGKGSKKSKADSEDFKLRVELDMCSKKGDVMGAICLYDSATREGIRIGQYHYTVLLYLCSSAAMGVIRPAKSGSGTRSLDMIPANDVGELCSNGYSLDLPKQDVESTCGSDNFVNESTDFLTKLVPQKYNSASVSANGDDEEEGEEEEEEESDTKDRQIKQEQEETQVSEDVKRYALERGFEIYKMMCSEKIRMNEAALTSVARMAMAMGNGDMAFDMVKQMKALGINPKLRSYGPALSAFCISGEIDKAFAVEKHMLEHGVHPEEPELEALLRVSVETGKADKVYYLLHKLRTCVRSVSQSTADLIEKWFKSKEAYRVGKMKWDRKMIARVMENVGGGWHGQGWLGRGKWRVLRSSVDADGFCKCCGEKLALIDLDPEDTDRFAESVASIAIKREKNSSFQKFQRWLNYYGPFEAVVDAANVGLYSQKRFKPSKVNAVVNGIRQKLPSRKWPLIVLHNKRLTGSKMDQPVNKGYVERWRNADALYATPTGSNDDWYWLYAAIKFKCLIVTNDEMRDHTFQLLGNDFFPKWKERHQVRFSFSEVGPIFHMPPPCSVVIQESEKGEWHIPVESHHQSEEDRTWLCITRAKSQGNKDPSKVQLKDQKENPKSDSQHSSPVIAFRNLRNILSESVSSDPRSVLVDIEAAEERGGCVIDFQI